MKSEEWQRTKGIKAPVFPNEITISVRNGLNINEQELSDLPLFYGKSKQSEYLIAGNSFYRCRVLDNNFIISEKENPRFDLERYILKYVNLKIITNG